jgi:cobalamin biosynthesis Mg chelatase CobN
VEWIQREQTGEGGENGLQLLLKPAGETTTRESIEEEKKKEKKRGEKREGRRKERETELSTMFVVNTLSMNQSYGECLNGERGGRGEEPGSEARGERSGGAEEETERQREREREGREQEMSQSVYFLYILSCVCLFCYSLCVLCGAAYVLSLFPFSAAAAEG